MRFYERGLGRIDRAAGVIGHNVGYYLHICRRSSNLEPGSTVYLYCISTDVLYGLLIVAGNLSESVFLSDFTSFRLPFWLFFVVDQTVIAALQTKA